MIKRRCTYNGREVPCPQSQLIFPLANHVNGSSLWTELHLWALSENPNKAWLSQWEKRVKVSLGTCTCYNHWLRLKEQNPVDWKNLFEWTVLTHNLVNRKLGKPEMTPEQAIRLYSPSFDTAPIN